MTDTITIPPEALEAAAKDMATAVYGNDLWNSGWLNKPTKNALRKQARAACLAMLKNWPMKQHRAWDDVLGLGAIIILPLTEPSDD
jgi:hypothetical protein